MQVISPLGGKLDESAIAAPRLDSLEGKLIGEVWNGDFAGDVTFPAIRKLLRERFQGIEFVPYSEFPYSTIRGTPAHQREIDERTSAIAVEKGCDAIIAGNGG